MRYVIGRKFDLIDRILAEHGVTASAIDGKLDADPTFEVIDTTADPIPVTIAIPASDPATHNALREVTAIALPVGQAEPTTAQGWLESGYAKATANVSEMPADGRVVIPIPGVPDGQFSFQLILGFDQ